MKKSKRYASLIQNVDKNKMYDYKEAIKLIVRARFHKIIENIKDEDIKQEILQEIFANIEKTKKLLLQKH